MKEKTYIYTTPDTSLLTGSLGNEIRTKTFVRSPLSTAVIGKNGVLLDIAQAPHVLIAGTTGSGKSVMLHSILASLLARTGNDDAEFLIIDPKRVEFEYYYRNHPSLFCPIITDPKEAITALQMAVDEMMDRYEENKATGCRLWTGSKLYIIIDEIADLLSYSGKKSERLIEQIARLGRGAGVHLIVATQHPTAKVLSRQITTNLDTRICLRVNDESASRLVLGHPGAEKLKGKGDAILLFHGSLYRFQGTYMSDAELDAYSHSWTETPQFKETWKDKVIDFLESIAFEY